MPSAHPLDAVALGVGGPHRPFALHTFGERQSSTDAQLFLHRPVDSSQRYGAQSIKPPSTSALDWFVAKRSFKQRLPTMSVQVWSAPQTAPPAQSESIAQETLHVVGFAQPRFPGHGSVGACTHLPLPSQLLAVNCPPVHTDPHEAPVSGKAQAVDVPSHEPPQVVAAPVQSGRVP